MATTKSKLSQNDWTSKLPVKLSEAERELFPEPPLKISGPMNKKLCQREPLKGLFERAEQWKTKYLKENPNSKIQTCSSILIRITDHDPDTDPLIRDP